MFFVLTSIRAFGGRGVFFVLTSIRAFGGRGVLLLLFSSILTSTHLFAQDAPTCKGLLLDALRRHHALPDSGLAVRRVMRITTVRRIGTRLDTVVNTAETIEWKGGEMMRAEGMEVWTDEQSMVIVDEKAKRVRLIDLSGERKIVAAQERFNAGYADSLVVYGRSFGCEERSAKGEKGTEVNFVIDSTMQAFFNAMSMSLLIDRNGDIRRMGITHPVSSGLRSTEYVVQELDRKWKLPESGEPVLNHFLDGSGKARSAYSGYRITRQ